MAIHSIAGDAGESAGSAGGCAVTGGTMTKNVDVNTSVNRRISRSFPPKFERF
jgi:hypothetical protein